MRVVFTDGENEAAAESDWLGGLIPKTGERVRWQRQPTTQGGLAAGDYRVDGVTWDFTPSGNVSVYVLLTRLG